MNESQYSNDPLVLQLYRGCTNTEAWEQVLDQLCDEVGVRSAVVQAIKFSCDDDVETYWYAQDSQTDFRLYQSLISDTKNPRFDRRRRMFAFGKFVGDEQLFVGREEMIQHKWFHQSLADLDCGRFLGALLPLVGDHYVAIGLHRSVGNPNDFRDEELRRLSMLLPHLRQATELTLSLGEGQRLNNLLGACLDRWQCGVVICDLEGRVEWMNRPAHERIGQSTVLHLRDGMLRAAGETDAALRRALRCQPARPTQTTFLALDSTFDRLHLAIQHLAGTDRTIGTGARLIMISDGNICGDVPATALSVMFGLTRAESLLASAIVRGSTLEEYARGRGVTIGTVRFQLRQVLSKTGSSRQSDLVRKVLCSAAAHAAGPEPTNPH